MPEKKSLDSPEPDIEICATNTIKFKFMDRVRILFGRNPVVTTLARVFIEPGISITVDTHSVYVPPIFKRSGFTGEDQIIVLTPDDPEYFA